LQDGVGGWLVPELFRPFDAATQLLDRRFQQAARDRQAEPPVLRAVHPRPVIRVTGNLAADALPGVIGGAPKRF